MTYWIIIADAARARLFSTNEQLDSFTELRQIEYPRGRAKGRDILSDALGRYGESGRAGPRSTMELGTEPHLVEERRFAHELAEFLHKAQARREFDQLALVAPPQFLGLLRAALSPVVEKRVVASVPKELTNVDPTELASQLVKILSPAIKQRASSE